MRTYILIDVTLLGELKNKPWLKRNRQPIWIAPLYGRDAIEVSPVIVDVESAFKNDRTTAMMELVNARTPQFGVSFIDSELSLQEIVQHLKKFIFILNADGEELTLRFADCLVLPALATTATPEQWAALVAPFFSWKVHDRNGCLVSLPMKSGAGFEDTPLIFNDTQLAQLKEKMAVDQLLLHLKNTTPSKASFLITLKAYELTNIARQMWWEAGHKDGVELVRFLSLVFDTDGKILNNSTLPQSLKQKDYEALHLELARYVPSQFHG